MQKLHYSCIKKQGEKKTLRAPPRKNFKVIRKRRGFKKYENPQKSI